MVIFFLCRSSVIKWESYQLWHDVIFSFRKKSVCFLDTEMQSDAQHSSYPTKQTISNLGGSAWLQYCMPVGNSVVRPLGKVSSATLSLCGVHS